MVGSVSVWVNVISCGFWGSLLLLVVVVFMLVILVVVWWDSIKNG